jgi:hypothetical protein
MATADSLPKQIFEHCLSGKDVAPKEPSISFSNIIAGTSTIGLRFAAGESQVGQADRGKLPRASTGAVRCRGAIDGDGLKGELPDARWNVAAAPLAGDHEGFAISGRREHGNSIGEYIHSQSAQSRATLQLSWCQSGYGAVHKFSNVFVMFFPTGYTEPNTS